MESQDNVTEYCVCSLVGEINVVNSSTFRVWQYSCLAVARKLQIQLNTVCGSFPGLLPLGASPLNVGGGKAER